MKPRSIASSALLMFVMAKGMQKGFILRRPCRRDDVPARSMVCMQSGLLMCKRSGLKGRSHIKGRKTGHTWDCIGTVGDLLRQGSSSSSKPADMQL